MHPDVPSDPVPRFVEHQGLPLAYTDEGNGPLTILAIPGLPGSIRDFRWLAPALGKEIRFIRIELPGFGDSGRNGYRGMSIAERAESVLTLMRELELGPSTLIGHSSGGTVVAHIARHHPGLVQQCVLVSANGPRPHYPVRAYKALCTLLESRLGRTVMRPPLRQIYRAFGFPAHLSDDERMYTTLDASATDFRLHRDNLRGLRQPTVVAWAEDDNLIPTDVFEELEAIAPEGQRLRFTDGGHNIQKTKAIEIAEAIRAHCT